MIDKTSDLDNPWPNNMAVYVNIVVTARSPTMLTISHDGDMDYGTA